MQPDGTQRPQSRIQLIGQPSETRAGTKKPLIVVFSICLFFLFCFSLLFLVPYRQWSFSPAWVFESVKRRFAQLSAFLAGNDPAFGITICQLLAAVLTGAALAACGAIFQSGFRNMLAGPSTMGVMAGGTLGLLVYLLVFVSADGQIAYTTADLTGWADRSVWEVYRQQLVTLLGCACGVGLTVGVAAIAGRGRLSASAMILSGTVLSTLTQNLAKVLQYYMILHDPTDPRIDAIRSLTMGSFDAIASWQALAMLAIPIIVCLAALVLMRHRLNLLSLSEHEAAAIGVSLRALRYGLIAIGTILTAIVVSFCGHIGFLGFMIPLAARRLTGPDMAKLLPVSLLLGSMLLLLVFDAAYVAGLTGYLNLFTSSIGCVVLLAALFKGKGGTRRAAD